MTFWNMSIVLICSDLIQIVFAGRLEKVLEHTDIPRTSGFQHVSTTQPGKDDTEMCASLPHQNNTTKQGRRVESL